MGEEKAEIDAEVKPAEAQKLVSSQAIPGASGMQIHVHIHNAPQKAAAPAPAPAPVQVEKVVPQKAKEEAKKEQKIVNKMEAKAEVAKEEAEDAAEKKEAKKEIKALHPKVKAEVHRMAKNSDPKVRDQAKKAFEESKRTQKLL